MFKINSRVAPLTYNDTEREAVNLQLAAIQEKHGLEFTSIKDVFSHLMRIALSDENTENTNAELVVQLEIKVQTLETDRNDAFELNTLLNAKLDEANEKVAQLERTVSGLENQEPPTPETIEVEVVREVPLTPNDNQMLLELKDYQKHIIGLIAERRYQRGYDEERQTVEKTAERMLFNRATLFDWGGEFKTFLNLKEFKK